MLNMFCINVEGGKQVNLLTEIEQEQIKGYTGLTGIRIVYKGCRNKERIQIYEGVVIARKGGGIKRNLYRKKDIVWCRGKRVFLCILLH